MQSRVLIVEDEPVVRRLAVDALLEAGAVPVEAASGPEALARLADRERFDAMVTDFAMPGGVTGLTLAERARTMRPDLRILVMSGTDGIERQLAGRYPLLAKPYSARQLVAEVARLFA